MPITNECLYLLSLGMQYLATQFLNGTGFQLAYYAGYSGLQVKPAMRPTVTGARLILEFRINAPQYVTQQGKLIDPYAIRLKTNAVQLP